ncbi:TonB-dependent receptor [Parablastomonas sp. CN1-191]|uniref:TonB-dependent receptor n=1 Tax=Parablastomonas sp. CN1-191 TaxID=3400908 RepID=UPI003BF8D5BE
MLKFAASTIAIALATTAPAGAADAGFEGETPIIVTARHDGYRPGEVDGTRTGTDLQDTPQSVAVLTREQLDDQGPMQLGEALRYVPGVSLGQGEGHRDQVILRGQSSTADFFVDGVRDDAQYYRPLYATERVEVLKGANALLFGRGGGGGVINRVAKRAQPGRTRGEIAAALDSFGAWSLAGDVNLGSDRAALRLNAVRQDFANHRDVYDGHFTGVNPAATVLLGDATAIEAGYEYVEDRRVTDRGVPSLSGSPIRGQEETFFGDPQANRSEVTAHIARARVVHQAGDSLTLRLTGQYATYDKFYANVVPTGATATVVSLNGYASGNGRDNTIVEGDAVWKGATGPVRHTLLAGFEAGWQSSTSTRQDALFAAPGGGTTLAVTVPLVRPLALPGVSFTAVNRSSASDLKTLSAFVQDQVELANWLQIVAGVRYDDFSLAAVNRISGAGAERRDGLWSPRLGVIVKPRADISLYASYARSFLPQSGDQFTALDASLATLEPERFRNLEVGAKWSLTPALDLAAAAFQVDRDNTRATDPVTGFTVLSGASRVRGFEASLAGKLAANWQASLGYSYQQGEITRTTTAAPAGRELDKLPRHQASAWTRYDVTPAFGLGLGAIHQSGQFATLSNAVRLPGFTRLDAAAYWKATPGLSLQVNVENVANTRYFPSAHTDNNIAVGAPRNARVTARLTF